MFKLEETNFRIDSENWKSTTLGDGTQVKINPKEDVTELLEGPFAGEQLFTQKAAFRETHKAGKRMPDSKEWFEILKRTDSRIIRKFGRNFQSIVGIALDLKLAGILHASGKALVNQGTMGRFWSSTKSGNLGRAVTVDLEYVIPMDDHATICRASVRCLAE